MSLESALEENTKAILRLLDALNGCDITPLQPPSAAKEKAAPEAPKRRGRPPKGATAAKDTLLDADPFDAEPPQTEEPAADPMDDILGGSPALDAPELDLNDPVAVEAARVKLREAIVKAGATPKYGRQLVLDTLARLGYKTFPDIRPEHYMKAIAELEAQCQKLKAEEADPRSSAASIL